MNGARTPPPLSHTHTHTSACLIYSLLAIAAAAAGCRGAPALDRSTSSSGILPGTIASRAEDKNNNRTRGYRNREEERTIGDRDSIKSNSNSINKSRRKRHGSEGRRSAPAATMVAVENQPPEQGHHNIIGSTTDAGGARDELSPRRRPRASPTSSTIAPAFLDGRGERSARQNSRAPRPSGVGGESLPSSRRPHVEERGAGVGVGGYSSMPGEGKSGGFGRSGEVAATSCGGRVFSESLGTGISWSGMAAAARTSGGSSGSRRRRAVPPLERSRGESLQRSLERVMEVRRCRGLSFSVRISNDIEKLVSAPSCVTDSR